MRFKIGNRIFGGSKYKAARMAKIRGEQQEESAPVAEEPVEEVEPVISEETEE